MSAEKPNKPVLNIDDAALRPVKQTRPQYRRCGATAGYFDGEEE